VNGSFVASISWRMGNGVWPAGMARVGYSIVDAIASLR